MQTIKSIVEKYTKEIQGAVAQEAQRLVAKHLSAGLGVRTKVKLDGAKVAKQFAKPAAKKVAAKVSKPTRRVRRTPSDITDDRNTVLAHIKANPGQRAEVIKAALKMTKKDWLLPITQLVKSGSVTTKGQKRATEYFAA